jgi:hypothetical protein
MIENTPAMPDEDMPIDASTFPESAVVETPEVTLMFPVEPMFSLWGVDKITPPLSPPPSFLPDTITTEPP